MQESGVFNSYSYNVPSEGMALDGSFGDPFGSTTRMTKRRRIDEGDATWNEGNEREQFPEAQSAIPPFGGATEYSVTQKSGGEQSALHASSETPALSQQWSSGASPYPDVSSYQQPYYQQTDPSIYTSPWPPTDTNYSGQNFNSVIPTSASMPYFPTTQTENQHTTDVFDTSYQGLELEAPNPQYAYATNSTQSRNDALYLEDASMSLKLQSLSILDNLATQLIHTIAKASYPQIQEMMKGNDSEDGQAYNTVKNLFDQTRKVYSRDTAFIDAIAIQMFQPSQQEIIRKANIATFISSILGAHDVSFFHLNEFFMETFVPLGHRLLKWQGAIYLELKTQTYISALMNSDGSPEAMLDELFPPDMDAQILTRHPDAPSLSPSEQDFIDRSKARKSYLLAEPDTQDAIQQLPKKYQWSDFVREFASCISKNVDGIMNVPLRAQAIFGGAHADKRMANTAQSVQDSLAGQQGILARTASNENGVLNGLPNIPTLSQQPSEKKSNVPSSTQRQPWTKPEEDALLAGLEKVNGPHWSQILALYGRGGSVSEVLKDRNQVQLKDKARNLKLWYLKMGKEVPVALRGVTGELRKRGGARARAAFGLLDDEDQQPGAEDAGEEGENVDPSLETTQRSKSTKKKKGRK